MPIVSVARDAGVGYPQNSGHAPAVAYPERLFPDERPGENRVYDLVRRALIGAGLDRSSFETANWNPLGEWIAPGARVFVLPNLVVERRSSEPLIDFQG